MLGAKARARNGIAPANRQDRARQLQCPCWAAFAPLPLTLSAAKLFAHDTTKNSLKGLLPFLNQCSKGIIDEGLVVGVISGVRLVPKPREDVIVQTDRDASLAGAQWNDRTPLGL